MRIATKMKLLWKNLLLRRNVESALTDELQAYIDELTDRYRAEGLPPAEARRKALVEAGGVEQIKEGVREAWVGHSIDVALRDIRQAMRSLLRSPGFSLIVVATLAVGIGASLTMFSLVRAVLLRPLPYPDPDRIVMIQVDARSVANVGATVGEVFDLKERARSFDRIAAINATDADLEYAGEKEHLTAANVSDSFLPMLGATPVLGRTLDSRIDESNDRALGVLISNELWRRRFGADPQIAGKSVLVNNVKVQIVGVLAPEFRLFLPPAVSASEQVDIWFPYTVEPVRRFRGIHMAARLKPGVTLAGANAELQTIAAQFEREYPDFYSGRKGWQASPSDHALAGKLQFRAQLLHGEITRKAKPALFLLSGAVGFVLLIACVNIANLMLARGSARQREVEIRLALGAGTFRIVRQLLIESLLLASASAGIGLLLARVALAVIVHQSASHIPLQSRMEVDPPVMLFALVLTVATSLVFGLAPAWRLASGQAGQALRAGRAETARSGARRLQRGLVVAEVALSIVPLACGGLMLHTFVNLLHARLGFNPKNVVTATVQISLEQYPRKEQRWIVQRDVMDRVRALPGVEAVSAATPLPLAENQETRRVGRLDEPDVPPILATQQGATPGYLRLIGTPLLEGRDFTDADISPARNVTIIDQRLADRLWPEGALGKRLAVYRTGWRHELEVIGITAPVRATRIQDKTIPHFMLPHESPSSLLVKTSQSAAQIAPGIAHALDAAHVGRAAFNVRSMSEYVSDSVGDTRFLLALLAAFAGVAVLLAAVGLYATLAYLTAQRTREFGIRLALGSSLSAILTIVLRESFLLSLAGTVLGLCGVAAVSGAVRQLLYGVRPLDGVTLAGVLGLVAIVSLGAACVPAWRAVQIDPQISLRSE